MTHETETNQDLHCPLCHDEMVKGFFGTHDGSGIISVWVCSCSYDDFIKDNTAYQGVCLYMMNPDESVERHMVDGIFNAT